MFLEPLGIDPSTFEHISKFSAVANEMVKRLSDKAGAYLTGAP